MSKSEKNYPKVYWMGVDWIRRHQIAAFFIITFAITWGLGFSYDAALNKDMVLLFPVVIIATCGPALAGIIISAVTETQPRQGTRKAFWIAFFAAWIVSASVFVANNVFINHAPFSIIMVVLIFFIVIPPVALVIASAYSRIPSVRSYLSSLIHLRGVWGWALVGLALFPGIFLLSTAASSLLGLEPVSALRLPESGLTLIGLIIVKFLYQLFFFNATGEETGWRGFALPRLQARLSPLIAALVIGFFWASWHFFLWQAEGRPVLEWQFWLEMYVVHMLGSLIIVWVCNRAGGSAAATPRLSAHLVPASAWSSTTTRNFSRPAPRNTQQPWILPPAPTSSPNTS